MAETNPNEKLNVELPNRMADVLGMPEGDWTGIPDDSRETLRLLAALGISKNALLLAYRLGFLDCGLKMTSGVRS